MIYRVTRPLVVVRSHGEIVYRTAGQEVDGVAQAEADRLVRRGMIEPTGRTAATVAEDSGDQPTAPAVEQVAAGVEPVKPKKTAPLPEWQAYAKSRGLSDADIEGSTKAELIAVVG